MLFVPRYSEINLPSFLTLLPNTFTLCNHLTYKKKRNILKFGFVLNVV